MAIYNISNRYRAVVIGGSAGSFQPITKILASIPTDFPLPIFLCLHRLKHVRNGFVEALSIKSNKPISEFYDKEKIRNGHVYLAPANYHMAIELGNTFSMSTEPVLNNSRPSIDVTFDTAAYAFKEKLIGILLSGANKDGAAGMYKVKKYGGLTIVQDLQESLINTMPAAAIALSAAEMTLKVDQIIEFLLQLHNEYKLV